MAATGMHLIHQITPKYLHQLHLVHENKAQNVDRTVKLSLNKLESVNQILLLALQDFCKAYTYIHIEGQEILSIFEGLGLQ